MDERGRPSGGQRRDLPGPQRSGHEPNLHARSHSPGPGFGGLHPGSDRLQRRHGPAPGDPVPGRHHQRGAGRGAPQDRAADHGLLVRYEHGDGRPVRGLLCRRGHRIDGDGDPREIRSPVPHCPDAPGPDHAQLRQCIRGLQLRPVPGLRDRDRRSAFRIHPVQHPGRSHEARPVLPERRDQLHLRGQRRGLPGRFLLPVRRPDPQHSLPPAPGRRGHLHGLPGVRQDQGGLCTAFGNIARFRGCPFVPPPEEAL